MARSGERALIELGCPFRIIGLSADGPCSRAEPDIYLQPRALKSRRRRLSLCSLPVPKQFVVSLRSLISFAQSPIPQDLAVCARNNPDVFSFMGRFLGCRSASELLGGHEILLSAFDCEQISRRSFSPLRGWRGCDYLAASPFRRSEPVRGTAWAPVWRPLPAHAECACCAAWIWACASSCQLNSSRLRRFRSNEPV